MNKIIFKKFFSKKSSLSIFGVIATCVTPILVSSCSSISQDLISGSYLTDPNNALTSNIDIKKIVSESLKTNEGMRAYLASISEELVLNWLEKTKDIDQKLKLDYNAEIEKIDKDYKSKVDQYKKDYGVNWVLKFQQEILDPAGGTEESYKRLKKLEFAKAKFIQKVLENLFLGVVNKKTNSPIIDPTAEQILDGLYGISGVPKTASKGSKNSELTYDFNSDTLLTSNDTTDPLYAAFQSFLFDNYVQYTNPYIVTMSLWKYGTPTSGINSYYTIETPPSSGDEGGDSSSGESNGATRSAITKNGSSSGDSEGGEETPQVPTTGTYIYPYFGNENATNTSLGTVDKFVKFLENAKSNYTQDKGSDLGLKKIPLSYTDDSGTAILVKNSSAFTDLYTEFAAGSAYLYGKIKMTPSGSVSTQGEIFDIDSQIKHDIDITTTNSTTPFDLITRQFVSTSKIYGATEASLNQATISELQLSKDFVSKVINPNGPLKTIFNSNSTSGMSATTSNSLYVVDNFVPGTITTTINNGTQPNDKSSLNEFMFLRNQAGVHAISIDGSTLISKATDEKDKKVHAGYVVLYRYLLGEKGYDKDFKVDLKTELSNFLSNNFDWIIYKYAFQNNQQLLDLSYLDETSKNLATSIMNYIVNLSFYEGAIGATQKMVAAKSIYNKNYGFNAYKNGFASHWGYPLYKDNLSSGTGSSGSSTSINLNNFNNLNLNPDYLYAPATLASTTKNPFVTNEKTGTSLYTDVINKVESLITNGFEKKESSFEGFKYSQYLYTKNNYVNAALNAFLGNANNVKALIENDAFKTYVGSFYDFEKNEFTGDNADVLNSSLFNNYYRQFIDAEADKWLFYNPSLNTGSENSETSSTIDLIKTYSKTLWDIQNEKSYSTKLINENSLCKTLATFKYLYESKDDSNSLFISNLDSKIGNSKAYIVWENSINETLRSLQSTDGTLTSATTNQTSTIKSSDLLEVSTNTTNIPSQNGTFAFSDKLLTNINNEYGGYYFANKNTTTGPMTYNLNKDGYYQSTYNDALYNFVDIKATTSGRNVTKTTVGFKGLQVSTSNSLTKDVSDALFENPFTNNIGSKGSLYQYESKAKLIQIVESIATIGALNNFAATIDKQTDYTLQIAQQINNEYLSIRERKDKFKELISKISEDSFQPFVGYVGEKSESTPATRTQTTDADPNAFRSTSAPSNLVGAYAIQVNLTNVKDYATLKQAFASSIIDPDDLIIHLIAQMTLDTSVQSIVYQTVATGNQFNIFDVRVANALGSDILYWFTK